MAPISGRFRQSSPPGGHHARDFGDRPTLGTPDIASIRPATKSRDDIPALLIGLRRLFELPARMVLPEKDRRVGRPGMEPVTVLVLGVVKRGSRTSLRPDPGAGERARVAPQPGLCGGMAHVLEVWDRCATSYLDDIVTAVDAAR